MQPELHTHADIYAKPFPKYNRPKVIGYIGIDNLMYARKVQNESVNFDLNLHLDKAVRKPSNLDVKLNDLLQFLVEHERRLNLPMEINLHKAKIFCYRGLLTCVACTPYENKDPWKIVAILHRGNIYLCARDTDEKIYENNNMSEQHKKFTSWGYKFEQYMLSESPQAEPNPDQPLDETKEFSVVFTTDLNQHTIIYGAEMDGVRCDKGHISSAPSTESSEKIVQYLSDKEFLELKTCRHMQFSKQEINFKRFKTKKWWCQSFLVGIDTIVCGFRDDDGIVDELKVYPVRDLAKMSERYWKPNVCLNFLDTFFTYVKRCLARKIKNKHGEKAINNIQELPLISLLFEWKLGMAVQVSQSYVHEDDPILTQHFMEHFGKTNKL